MDLYYKEFGSGNPLLILHGLFGFSDNWQTIARKLAERRLVITPDLRNHGRSPHVPTHTYGAMSADLHTFMTGKWIFSADLVGHSMGGKVAMQFALDHPDMVNRLVVIDMEPGQARDNHGLIFEVLMGIKLSDLHTREEVEAQMREGIPDVGTRQFLLKNVTRDESGSFIWKMNLPVLRAHFEDILSPVTDAVFEKPVLFIRGELSDYIREASWPSVLRMFPRAELFTVSGAGHWVHADKPAEVVEAIETFLGD